MRTLRLRTIQQPVRVERLLETCVQRGHLLPEGAYQIRDPEALPSSLQWILSRKTGNGHAWACWTDGSRSWLFTGELRPPSRERGAPMLGLSLYDEAGELKDSAAWGTDFDGKWQRSAA
jgi:hypothetical protein